MESRSGTSRGMLAALDRKGKAINAGEQVVLSLAANVDELIGLNLTGRNFEYSGEKQGDFPESINFAGIGSVEAGETVESVQMEFLSLGEIVTVIWRKIENPQEEGIQVEIQDADEEGKKISSEVNYPRHKLKADLRGFGVSTDLELANVRYERRSGEEWNPATEPTPLADQFEYTFGPDARSGHWNGGQTNKVGGVDVDLDEGVQVVLDIVDGLKNGKAKLVNAGVYFTGGGLMNGNYRLVI